MDDQLRKAYLDAMGITQWVVRQPALPEAEVTPAVAAPAVQPVKPVPTTAKPDVPPQPTPEPQQRVESVTNEESPPAWLTEAPLPDEGWYSSEASHDDEEQRAPRSVVADLGWDALQKHVAACKACELHRTRTQTVFGVGNQQTDLLIIGEAPGADEDRQGEPFVGKAGKLLNAMLKAIGFERNQVYIANILKCRPPDNRDPHVEEAAHCEPFLMRQIELIAPKVILAVGRVSAQNLLKSSDAVGRLRGRVHRFGTSNIPLVVTYHPAYLLRSPEQKSKSWQDLQQALSLLQE
ncbi:uracil-DNA glycosylase family protein [Pseudomonadota bacterium]